MKNLSEYQNILAALDKRAYQPIYCLDGMESYFADVIAGRIEHEALNAEQRAFNLQILYGKDVKMTDVLSSARRFPMMADYQVILVREAQEMKDFDNLLDYALQPVPTTILVFVLRGKSVNRSTRLGKALKKFVHFTGQELRDYELEPWLQSHLKMQRLQMEPQAVRLLLDNTGPNLHRIEGELSKILANTGNRKHITAADVAASTGIDRQYNVFEFSRALRSRNLYKSLEIATVIGRDKKNSPIQVIIPVLNSDFRKIMMVQEIGPNRKNELLEALRINPYFLAEFVQAAGRFSTTELRWIMNVLNEFDHRSKGIGQNSADDHELLRELVVRLIQ